MATFAAPHVDESLARSALVTAARALAVAGITCAAAAAIIVAARWLLVMGPVLAPRVTVPL